MYVLMLATARYQKAQTQIKAARAELTGEAKPAGDTKPSSS